MAGELVHFEIRADDFERAKAFYGPLLGWSFESFGGPTEYTMVNAGGDKKAALELLNEAKAIVASTPQSAAELLAQLRLAQAYLRLDADQAFAILQPVE